MISTKRERSLLFKEMLKHLEWYSFSWVCAKNVQNDIVIAKNFLIICDKKFIVIKI